MNKEISLNDQQIQFLLHQLSILKDELLTNTGKQITDQIIEKLKAIE